MVLTAAPRACGPAAQVLSGPVPGIGIYLTFQGVFGAAPIPDWPGHGFDAGQPPVFPGRAYRPRFRMS
jgi:hypothetical protein